MTEPTQHPDTPSADFTAALAAAIASCTPYKKIATLLNEPADATLAIAPLGRPAVIATRYFTAPRQTLVVTDSPGAAEKMHLQLGAFLPPEANLLLPDRETAKRADHLADLRTATERARALYHLERGVPALVVTSVQALMRLVPPPGHGTWDPLSFRVGVERGLESVVDRLVEMGYGRAELATEEGTFSVRGDILDVHPPLGTQAIRVEFFGDDVESIKRFSPQTSQTIGELTHAEVFPIREIKLTAEVAARGARNLSKSADPDSGNAEEISYHAGLLAERIAFAEMERYLHLCYERLASPAEYVSPRGLVVALEPRSLFDAAVRRYGELDFDLATTHYLNPGRLDFGKAPRLTMLSLMTEAKPDAQMKVRRPDVGFDDPRFTATLERYHADGEAIFLALPNRRLYERAEAWLDSLAHPVPLTLLDHDVVTGFVMPDARLAVISQADAFPRSTKSSRRPREIDPTKVTFSFKPGDFVVHETYGVAKFVQVVRREFEGVDRDYMELQFAGEDTVFTPIEQIGKVTRYVGPEGAAPSLTRLGTNAWARATARARKAAKKLAFDLVNLYARRSQVRGHAFADDTMAQAMMEAAFPYEETPDQIEAIADVKADMEAEKPMDRLVCGDVGYGKTEVAIRAAFKAVQDGKQVMVLCPTTILAQQHFTNFSERFGDFGVRVEVLSRFRTDAQQREALDGFASGEVGVLIGTHRLLSADVAPHDLGLLIIDEEQRFGVEHKEKLKNMREQIDVLALSATPIPRTLLMSLSGVRDMSVIDTPPPNRHPVEVYVGDWNEQVVFEAIGRELGRGGQVYYVSNRVRTIDDAVERVESIAPQARIGVAHGQMSEHELESVMERFAANQLDILVATTIIESGIDNPHSNTLIIEDSQRLGLAQLYQLKGRVGRSHTRAYAYFLYPAESPLTDQAYERLTAIAEHDDLGSGIRIAMRDLEIRGAGSLIGGEQSGQLAAVGFDLFAGMLAEAVAAARGEDASAPIDVALDFDVPAYLPDEYIEDIFERVNAYRRVAAIASVEGAESLRARLEREYGALPEPTENLLALAALRARCAGHFVGSVVGRNGAVTIRFERMLDRVQEAAVAFGARVDGRRREVHWKGTRGESVVEAATQLAGGILSTD